MKFSKLILRPRDWRLGFRSEAEKRYERDLMDALAALPDDIDPDELREFLAPELDASQLPDPLFKARLRSLLWGLIQHRGSVIGRLSRKVN